MKMMESVATEWSNNTTTLGEIARKKSFPCVVKVCEKVIGNDDGLSPFSSGDLIKIDSLNVIQKIRGRFVEWEHASGSYEEIIHHDASIPVAYEGFVQVLPRRGPHYVYHSIQDLMSDFPRYVIIVDGIASHDIPKDEVLETLGWNAPHGSEPSCFKFRSLVNKDIKIPSTTLGRFQVLPDEMKYTLQEVIQRFPLPQIVQFTDQISKEQMSIEMEETILYRENFERKVMLERVYMEHVLLAQYKGAHPPNPVTVKFRSATLLIPLRNSDLQQIRVQYALHRNSGEYGFFVTENFRETKTVRQFMDKISKFESIKKPSIRFLEMGPSPSSSQSTPPTGRPLPATPSTDADVTREVEKGIKAKLKGLLRNPGKSREKTIVPLEPKSRSSWAFDIKDEWDEDYEKLDFKKLTDTRDNENYQTLEPNLYEKPFIMPGNCSIVDNLKQTTISVSNDYTVLELTATEADG